MEACAAIVPATSRPPKSDHSFLRHIVPFCQKRDELTRERVAGWTNRHGAPSCITAVDSLTSEAMKRQENFSIPFAKTRGDEPNQGKHRDISLNLSTSF